jgi:hypothetical protein
MDFVPGVVGVGGSTHSAAANTTLKSDNKQLACELSVITRR